MTRIRCSAVGLVLAAASLVACSGKGSDAKGGSNAGASSAGEERFFLPTGEPTNTAAPILRLDAGGGLHAVYPAFINGGAFYAYCSSTCSGRDDVKLVPFDTDGTVGNAMLALDGNGKPRVLLSTMQYVYYAACEGDCADPGAWTTTKIIDHGGDREVSGQAFALDSQGRPRFLMHTYKAYLGVGQKTPATFWVSCDADCSKPEAWKSSKISDQIWQSTKLTFDSADRAHVATVASVDATATAPAVEMAAYGRCDGDCDQDASWNTAALGAAFESTTDVVDIKPAISMALTAAGTPRVLLLGADNQTGARNLTYFECSDDCTGHGWMGSVISTSSNLGPGLELALDAKDHPRFVHTLDYNIALAYCDDDACSAENAKWDLTKVEYGADMKPDEIFLYTNCTVGAWFLHSPSLVLTQDGRPRVGYQARDMSGGFSNPTPATTPDCKAGTDMTWSRVAIMSAVH